MCEPLFSTVKSVVADIGFCVANGIFALVTKGVYAGSLIKKRQYWPKSVSGDLIGRQFEYKELGYVDML